MENPETKIEELVVIEELETKIAPDVDFYVDR